jgi:glycosyltransferase involved in cell wall biosynthesis
MLPKSEIVIGICTKNCEKTIGDVLRKVDQGLVKNYPKRKALMIVSDISKDRTEERVREVETKTPKFFTRQDGGPGKGNGIRTVFRLAMKSGARVVALVDGDLTSIRGKWIRLLVDPIDKGFDLAVPFYERHKYDSVITNHIIFPFVASIYGTEIRQPIGGEFGLSDKLVRKLLGHPKFPEGFGIDIFITTTAIAEGLEIAETTLGIKAHTSTEEYRDFEKLLIPMFNQVVSTLFDLTVFNRNKIKAIAGVKNVMKFGGFRGGQMTEPVVDRKDLYKMFKRDFQRVEESDMLSLETKEQLREVIDGSTGKPLSIGTIARSVGEVMGYMYWRARGDVNRPMRSDILSEGTKKEIRHAIYGRSGQIISVDTWVNAVYDALRRYKDPAKRQEAIDVLRTVWLGRFSSFVRQTRLPNA